jgi:hypothetical protein
MPESAVRIAGLSSVRFHNTVDVNFGDYGRCDRKIVDVNTNMADLM